jgi:SAM-dependent methyltransferase
MEDTVYTTLNKVLLKELGLEAGLVQTIFRPCAERLVELLYANIEEDTRLARVLDIGCGSGIVGRVIADYVSKSHQSIRALHGFDLEEAAVDVATIKTIDDERFEFWKDDATTFEPKGGEYDAIVAQHLIQHIPENVRVQSIQRMIAALKAGGWLVLGVWPRLASKCKAYDFLYRAAGESGSKDPIGMVMSELVKLVKEDGFTQIKKFPNLKFSTKPVKNRAEFLRQYFEGSLGWLGRDENAWREQFQKLAGSRGLSQMGRVEEGNMTFDIKMHVILAKKKAEGGQL